METGKNKFDTFSVGRTKKEELRTVDKLLIESELNQISYVIIDKKAKQCIGLCSVPLAPGHGRIDRRDFYRDLLDTDYLLKFPFSKRQVLLSNRECLFIPEEIYNEAELEQYIKISFGNDFSGKCFAIKMPELKNYLVFKTPDWILKLYDEKLSGASISHATVYLVETMYRLSKQKNNVLVHAHFKTGFFELIIFDKGKFLFYNSFTYQTSEDIAYFIMYALKQWEIEEKIISISGILNADSDELYWLKKYLLQINSIPNDTFCPYPAALEEPARFINLLNPTLCE
jgi:hypothetical protein